MINCLLIVYFGMAKSRLPRFITLCWWLVRLYSISINTVDAGKVLEIVLLLFQCLFELQRLIVIFL